jgi:replication-associated recombination protein RarA
MKVEKCKWLKESYDSINLKTLPHGIIINGPSGIGKSILAKKIASDILLSQSSDKNISDHANLIESSNHPDLYILDKDKVLINDVSRRAGNWDDEKGNRDIITFLSLTPSISKNKVVLIHNADSMNEAAQNALLKTLEEPASFSYIIMTSNRPKVFKETIYSRCQVISIKNTTMDETNNWLKDIGISDYSAMDFPSFATPFNILEDIRNNDQNKFKDFLEVINNFINNKVDQTQSIKLVNDLDIKLVEKINYLVEFLKIMLKSKITGNELSGSYKLFNDAQFNKLKISNVINDLNQLRYDFYKVSSINESHVLNYIFSELKQSIRL